MTIFKFDDYKDYFNSLMKNMPKEGYGQFKRVAAHLKVNSVIISQIFRGPRDLSTEQALEIAEYLGLSKLETDYFLLLVRYARAGTHKLKAHLKNEMQTMQEKSRDLKNRVSADKHLTNEARAIFYSSWYYSGIRLMTSIDGLNDIDGIANHLSLQRSTVKRVLDFLVANGLCVEKNGLIQMGPKTTHLESSSELVGRHHANWRLKGLQSMDSVGADELFYTGPMTLSEGTAKWIRGELVQLIQKVVEKVKDSKSEKLSCLNIDWFDIKK